MTEEVERRSGPLLGVRVIEFASIGPGPLAAMVLADLGADVIRIERPDATAPLSGSGDPRLNILNRGRRSVSLNLRTPDAVRTALALVETSDVVIEGYRPGVAERMGIGPEHCLRANPAVVYGRITGWGQTGPRAQTAGHDINYLAVTGALWAIGRPPEAPVVPLNLLGDFGGGSLFLALGVVSALLESRRSAQGQVVDVAITDGVNVMTTLIHALRAMGVWNDERGANALDSGAPHYNTYECGDGRFIAVGALEDRFYQELVRVTGFIEPPGDRLDPSTWAERRERWAALFRCRPRDEWALLAAGTDACLTPVLDWREAVQDHAAQDRGSYLVIGGLTQPAPAPRFSRTAASVSRAPGLPGEDTVAVLTECGFTEHDLVALRASGAIPAVS